MARPKINKKYHKISINVTLSPINLNRAKKAASSRGCSLSSLIDNLLYNNFKEKAIQAGNEYLKRHLK